MSRLVFLPKAQRCSFTVALSPLESILLLWKRALEHWKMQQSWMHFGQSQRATVSAWCCNHFLFYLGAWRSAKQQILTFIDTGELSHQNRSPPWEPRPACYSSCSPFFTEAATQDRSSFHCYAFTTAVVQLAIDVCNPSSARDLLFHNEPGLSDQNAISFW